MFVEYAGLTQEAATLVECFRASPSETKSDILVRVLAPLRAPLKRDDIAELDLGQGARLRVGEGVVLFLSEDSKRARQPHATAEVRHDGFYLFGKKIEPSKGSVLQPAMRLVQEKVNHRNDKGEIISLSAWRQWHVVRGGQLVSIVELKDPALARKRGRALSTPLTAEELGL